MPLFIFLFSYFFIAFKIRTKNEKKQKRQKKKKQQRKNENEKKFFLNNLLRNVVFGDCRVTHCGSITISIDSEEPGECVKRKQQQLVWNGHDKYEQK